MSTIIEVVLENSGSFTCFCSTEWDLPVRGNTGYSRTSG
jgi:hypothetical protein